MCPVAGGLLLLSLDVTSSRGDPGRAGGRRVPGTGRKRALMLPFYEPAPPCQLVLCRISSSLLLVVSSEILPFGRTRGSVILLFALSRCEAEPRRRMRGVEGGGAIYAAALRRQPGNISRSPTDGYLRRTVRGLSRSPSALALAVRLRDVVPAWAAPREGGYRDMGRPEIVALGGVQRIDLITIGGHTGPARPRPRVEARWGSAATSFI